MKDIMEKLKNYINGKWTESKSAETIDVVNPATQEVMGLAPYGEGTTDDIKQAVTAATTAFKAWRDVPVMKRVQPLYQLKSLLEDIQEELAVIITKECGKTLAESRGEILRAIENIEVACGAPMLIQSEFSENVASGMDEFMIRQPVGVTACIAPFNFPAMISFWFLPYALACGNSMIIKPSEKVPLTMMKIFELIDRLDIQDGRVSRVHGGKESVDAILDHPYHQAISFLGCTTV